MKANYCKGAKMPYTFQVSIYQMAILLLFNEKDKNSYEEIAQTTAAQRRGFGSFSGYPPES